MNNDPSAEQQIWRSFAAARHFCSAKILAGGTAVGTGVLTAEDAAPAQRNFQRKFALRRVGSTKFVVPPISNRSKVRDSARLVTCPYRATPGSLRGSSPSVSGGVQRNPFQGVPLGNFFLTVDAVLLCAAKKNGVESTRLAGYCQLKLALAATARSNPPLLVNSKKEGRLSPPNPHIPIVER